MTTTNPSALALTGALQPATTRPAWLDPVEFPFRSRFLQVEDACLHYVDQGTGPTLLLLHGSPMWSFMYRRLIAALSDRYRCVAVDLPGLGLSAAPLVRGRGFARNAELLASFVRALDLSDATLAVHATAGPSGLAMAAAMPERFRRLIVSNSFAWSLLDDRRLARFVRIVSSRAFAFFNVYGNLLPRLTVRLARRGGRFTAAERAAILGPYRSRAARRQLQNLLYGVRVEDPFFRELPDRLRALRDRPTLFLFGDRDNGYRAGFADRWRRLLPLSELVVLEGAMHFPLEDDPDRCVDEIARFLEATA